MQALARRAQKAVLWRARAGAERLLERRYGVETSKHLYLEDLGLPAENRVWHDPSEWIPLHRALRRLRPGGADVFVDFGSGLGRALVVAARFPFARVAGVEVSDEMNAVARRNLDLNASRLRAGQVDVVTSDALEFAIPDDLTVAYFYCPFYGDVFAHVLDNLLASVDRRPRVLRMLYNYPVEHARVLATGRARLVDAAPATWPRRSLTTPKTILTYQLLPADEAEAARLEARVKPRIAGAECWLEPYDPGFGLEKPERLGGRVR